MGKGLYNTKIKVYADGTTNIVYCSSQIFGEQRKFSDHVKSDEDIASVFGYDEGYMQPHHLNSDTDFNVKMKKIHTECIERDIQRIEKERVRPDVLKRAKDKVFDIVYQNDFAYFVTITFDKEKVDRETPQAVMSKLTKWLNNMQQRKGLKYILIPEYHEKGGIHCHALVNDVFTMLDSGRVMYKKKAWNLADLKRLKVYTGGLSPVYNISEWKYGFSTAIALYGERGAVAHYMTKYITKDLKKIFGKYYWSSRSCVRDTEILYDNTDFDELNLKEFKPIANLKFKYEGMTYSHVNNVSNVINPESVKAWEQPPQIDYSNLPWGNENL